MLFVSLSALTLAAVSALSAQSGNDRPGTAESDAGTANKQSQPTSSASPKSNDADDAAGKEASTGSPASTDRDGGDSGEIPKPLQAMLAEGTSLNPENTVFLDLPKRRLLLQTRVVCEDCLLEMLCCQQGTKEHESILIINGKAATVHAGLLALPLEAGTPVSYSPDFKAPNGPVINIFVNWMDADGKLQRKDVRSWIRHAVFRYYSHKLNGPPPGVELPHMELRYDKFNKEILWYGPMSDEQRRALLALWEDAEYRKAVETFYRDGQSRPLTADFVFAGSYYHTDPESGTKYYAAEGGYLICVANFADALLDVREQSSANEGTQSYEAWKGQVPPRGTPVVMELVPEK
ncbi:MAG: hypothetical protein KDA89_14505 [Planctomycetaceae bacterium]|nr:hypothetical protein [Planctomycetaceae bacterium]